MYSNNGKLLNKKAFTLIELLAVIVILAIIALIAVPIILGIINDVKISKYKSEENFMKEAANLYYATKNMEPLDEILLQDLIDNKAITPVKDTGNGGYCEGKVIKLEDGKLKGCLQCSNYYTKDCGYTGPLGSKDSDSGEVSDVIIEDTNPGIICGDKEDDYDSVLECHIRSVEDLVAFSKLVNSGKTFEGKTVYLDNSLNINDFTKGKSYVEPEKVAVYDINGDGSATILKDEMTTGKGFMPIGTESNPFEGKFEGQAKTISNLMINRPEMNNVGLFGYIGSNATIIGFNLKDANITGNDNTGGITGNNNGIIKEVTTSGSITGNDNVAGMAGLQASSARINSSIATNVNVTGNSYVYGLSSNAAGVLESGTIKGNSNVYGAKNFNLYVNKDVVIDSTNSNSSRGGKEYTDNGFGNLNIYDSFSSSQHLDTWIGGDNDSSGYYFDYDNKGSVVLRSVKDYPIDTTLEGSGTKEDPYKIYTAEDMKKISAMPTQANYYKLMNDIDYKDKKYYMLGSGANQFRGTFEGGANTLKNISLQGGWMYTGLFGDSSGTVIGLNVENANIIGDEFVGGICGNNGTVKETTISGTITGNGTVGGICPNCDAQSVIINADINGPAVGSRTTGIFGGKLLKGGNPLNFGYNLSTTDDVTTCFDCYSDTPAGNLNLFNHRERLQILDTWLGGDNDSSGYYFDYDSTGKIVLRSTEKHPIDTTLKGSGTKEDPYQIYTAEDMKKIAAMPTEANYYKLMNDIDYSNKKYYMIGTSANPFRGIFDGGASTLKNIQLVGHYEVGPFGYITGGKVEGLNIDNVDVKAYQRAGAIVGYSYGQVTDVSVNGKVKSKSESFGIGFSVQYAKGVLVNVNVNGNAISNTYTSNVTAIFENGSAKDIGGQEGYIYITSKANLETQPSNKQIIIPAGYYNNLKYYGSLKVIEYADASGNTYYGKDYVIETPYSGDANGNGYYFDYNSDGTDIVVVKVGSGPTAAPENPTTSPELAHEVKTDDSKSTPECILNSFDVVGSGFNASYTCSDTSGIVEKKHIYWVRDDVTDYDSLVEWTSTTKNTQVSVNSTWTESSAEIQKIDSPVAGSCYYFYYGAKNEYGNERIYRTSYCLSY